MATLLSTADPCLDRAQVSSGVARWGWTRSSTGTRWTSGGCELDPATGKSIAAKNLSLPASLAQPGSTVLTVDTSSSGQTYAVRARTNDGPPRTEAIALPSSTTTTILSTYPFVITATPRPSRFLFTAQGWTMLEGKERSANIAFWHSATLDGVAKRLEFVGPFLPVTSEIGHDGDFWMLGELFRTGSFGTTKLTHQGATDETNYFVSRFRDWPSVVAAHGT